MPFYKVRDWTSAYEIEPHIADAMRFYEAWQADGESFRAALPESRRLLDLRYGPAPRNLMDIFLPEAPPRGLVVFVHGGYWSECDKSLWSQFSEGALRRGYAVCIPGYTLCPEARIAGIGREVAAAVELAAGRIAGPIALTGHSAGGHLASRLIAGPRLLSGAVLARIGSLVSISGLHDLRPLLATALNGKLGLDEAEAVSESPALLHPARDIPVTCWAGSAERAEFLRQNALLANVWAGLGAATRAIVAPDRHHFDVIDELRQPGSDLIAALLDPLDPK